MSERDDNDLTGYDLDAVDEMLTDAEWAQVQRDVQRAEAQPDPKQLDWTAPTEDA